MNQIKQVVSIVLLVVGSGYIGYATFILNSLPDQIAESKAATQRNELLKEIRNGYNTQTQP